MVPVSSVTGHRGGRSPCLSGLGCVKGSPGISPTGEGPRDRVDEDTQGDSYGIFAPDETLGGTPVLQLGRHPLRGPPHSRTLEGPYGV